MKRRSLFQASPVRIALLLAAVALGAWQAARLADSLWPGERKRDPGQSDSIARGQPEGRPRPGPGGSDFGSDFAPLDARQAGTPQRPAEAVPPSGGSTPDGPVEPQTEEERAAAQALADSMKRFVISLEFNVGLGLPEPPQGVVVRPPDPWRPNPAAEGLPPPVIEDVDPRAGPASGGTRVTIRGRNLRASQVLFGLAPAIIVIASPEAVTVLAPEGSAGPVVIAVTNDNGSYALAGVPFTYGN